MKLNRAMFPVWGLGTVPFLIPHISFNDNFSTLSTIHSPWYNCNGWLGIWLVTYSTIQHAITERKMKAVFSAVCWSFLAQVVFEYGSHTENGESLDAEQQTLDWKVSGSSPGRSGRRILFSGVNFLCWFFRQYLFHPHVTPVECKEPVILPKV